MILRNNYQVFQIVHFEKVQEEDTVIEFFDASSAAAFLYGFMSDYFNIISLRKLAGCLLSQDLSRINDHEIIKQIALRIASGSLRIIAQSAPLPTWEYYDHSDIKQPEIAFDLDMKPQESVKRKEPVIDPALIAQAETLKSAAQSGTPLCEV